MGEDNGQIFRIALGMLPQIDATAARALMDAGITPEDFFNTDPDSIADAVRFKRGFMSYSQRDGALADARREFSETSRHSIRVLSIFDDAYPLRLSQAPDAPVVLFQLGDTNLDALHVAGIVGTRRPTAYGLDFCARICSELAPLFPELTIVSGLAYGIDAAAHQGALDNGLPTVAVVAHGLDMIYPAANRDLARHIVRNGGSIVSEYPFHTTPFRKRFLERNRIVAALSDVLVIVESDIIGGAMSTARTAFSYSREVMAVPGRITDQLSAGCNLLIKKQQASILTGARDIMDTMGWTPQTVAVPTQPGNLFPELEGDTKKVFEFLRQSSDPVHMDAIGAATGLPAGKLSALLSEMEFDGLLLRHPGNRFSVR